MGCDDQVIDEDRNRTWSRPAQAVNWYREKLDRLIEMLEDSGVLQLEDEWAVQIQREVAGHVKDD